MAVDTKDPETPTKTGKLVEHRYGDYWTCIDCDTNYPAIPAGLRDGIAVAKCNGHEIHVCPWCRPDSQPWKWGRGV